MTAKILPLLKIAWKDAHGSKKQLFLYCSGLFLGIAIIVFSLAVRSQLMQIIDSEAKAILGADLSILSKDPVSTELLKDIKTEASLKEVRFRSMVLFKDGSTRLTQVRASEKGYPFYGEVLTDPPAAWEKLKNTSKQVLLDQALFLSSSATVGQIIKIGKSDFTISGSVTKIPGTSVFNSAVAPRIYISYGDALETGLLSRQSVADYFLYLKFRPEMATSEIQKLSQTLPAQYSLETIEQRLERLGRINDNVLTYFSLAGLACIILGALGASTSVYFYLQSKLKDSAILKCLGLSSLQISVIYLLQIVSVSAITAFFGSICGTLAFYLIIPELAAYFSVVFSFIFPLKAFLIGITTGVFTILLAAAPGILILKKTSALILLKEQIILKLSTSEKLAVFITAFFACPAFLVLVLPVKQALMYGSGLNIIIIFLAFLSLISQKLALRIGKLKLPFITKYALSGLGRPGNTTTALINAFTLSSILAATLLIVQHYIKAQISVIKTERTANLFIYDVAEDQTSDIRSLLNTNSIEIAEEVPIVLMRIKKIKDKNTTNILNDKNSDIPAWTLKRDYWTSYRENMLPNEELITGNWVGKYDPKTHSEIIPISIDAKLADHLKVDLGDKIEFDIQGVTFITQVSSLRKIHWEQMQRNAFVIFPVGVLEDAPKFLFLTAHAPDVIKSAQIQRSLVQQFSGISVVDIRFVADSLIPVLNKIAQAIILLSSLVILTACMILITSIIGSKGSRDKEYDLLLKLGATRAQTYRLGIMEYFIIAAISSFIGLLLSITLSYILAIYIFKLPFDIPWYSLIIISLCSLGLVSVIAYLSGKFSGRRGFTRIINNDSPEIS